MIYFGVPPLLNIFPWLISDPLSLARVMASSEKRIPMIYHDPSWFFSPLHIIKLDTHTPTISQTTQYHAPSWYLYRLLHFLHNSPQSHHINHTIAHRLPLVPSTTPKNVQTREEVLPYLHPWRGDVQMPSMRTRQAQRETWQSNRWIVPLWPTETHITKVDKRR